MFNKLLLITLCLLLLVLGACSGTANPAGLGTPTVAISTVAPTTIPPTQTNQPPATGMTPSTAVLTATTAASSATPTPGSNNPAETCGAIQMQGTNPPQDASALSAEQCFWRAYQQCQATTLTVTMMGVDAGTVHTFAVKPPGNPCPLVDTVSRYFVPRPTPPPQATKCESVSFTAAGLLFKACGEQGDILIPSP